MTPVEDDTLLAWVASPRLNKHLASKRLWMKANITRLWPLQLLLMKELSLHYPNLMTNKL